MGDDRDRGRRASLRRLPAAVVRAVKLVHRSAPNHARLALCLQLFAGLAVGGQVLVARRVIAALAERREVDSVLPEVVALAVLSAVVVFAAQARAAVERLLGFQVGNRALQDLHAAVQRVPLEQFERPGFHDGLSRAVTSALTRPVQLCSGGLVLVSSGAAVLAVLAVVAVAQPLVAVLLAAAYVPLYLLLARAAGENYLFQVNRSERDRERAYVHRLLVGRDEAKELRAYGLDGHFLTEFERLSKAWSRDLRRLVVAQLWRRSIGSVLVAAATALGTVLLVRQVSSGASSVAEAGSLALALVVLAQRLSALLGAVASLLEGALFLDDYEGFLAQSPRDPRPAPEQSLAPLPPLEQLEVRDVAFTYPGAAAPALRGLSLTLWKDEVVALVGVNGSGKTTLAKVIGGLWAPSAGSVRWNGQEIGPGDLPRLRARTATIFQDFLRYELSAGRNVELGDVERGRDEAGLLAATEASGARFLADLPLGFDTILTPNRTGGTDLSGGQWQRVALARAFYRDASLLVLDEPTAALDPRAEAELFAAVRRLAAGRAVLLITHRFVSARLADRICVMDGGRVVEQGDHHELVARGGPYAELYALQSALHEQPSAPAQA